MKSDNKPQNFIFLHISFIIYSFVGVFSKTVSQQPFFSLKFILYGGIVFFILAVYALLWQQILKRFPLVTAYSNKGVVIIWNLLWAVIFFSETITIENIIGSAIIIAGIAVVSSDAS
jgi:drug/metabolite transporter (DMT)-like permease